MIAIVNTDPFLMLLLTNSRREITKRKNLTTNAPEVAAEYLEPQVEDNIFVIIRMTSSSS